MKLPAELVRQARAFATDAEPAITGFEEELSTRRAAIEAAYRTGRDATLNEVFASDVWRFTPRTRDLCDSVRAYCHDADWVLSDLFKLAALTDDPPDVCGALLVGPGLTHFSYRLVDDVIDGHDSYKGMMPTALGRIKARWGPTAETQASHGNLLVGVAILTAAGHATEARHLPDCFETVAGAVAELMDDLGADQTSYRAMVAAKSVSYSRALYGPVIERFAPQNGALQQFLEQGFLVGQLLNDAHDFEDDKARGQPNFFVIAGDESVDTLMHELGTLRDLSERLAPPLDAYALSRLASLANYLALIGEGGTP